MKMVEDYRDIQNKIKALNEELGPIKEALTRHLVAGDEDKIELPDGSYVISKVMVALWTYSDKLEAKRIKPEAEARPRDCREERTTERQRICHLQCTRCGGLRDEPFSSFSSF